MLSFITSEAGGVMIVAFEAVDEEGQEWHVSRRDWLDKAIESREDGRFALALTDVGDLASSEIGFPVTVKRRVDRRRGRVVLCWVAPSIRDTFRTMNLHGLLDAADTRTAALARLEA